VFFLQRPPTIQARVIAVIGMHRSGTSCLTGSLQEKGLFLGEVHEWNQHNQKGNRENETLATLNEDVLIHNGGSWHQPPTDMRWNRSLAKRRNTLIKEFEATSKPVWGFKDTRVSLTWPFWEDVIPSLEYVGTFRHPLLVARSLQKRDNMPTDYALNLWCDYNSRILALYQRKAFPIISFDLDANDYLAAVDTISRTMRLLNPDGEAFLDKSLKSSSAAIPTEELDNRTQNIFNALNQAYQETLLVD
jgi:hypothetical protein